jgi:DNA-binding MarR family transcriptional regulator
MPAARGATKRRPAGPAADTDAGDPPGSHRLPLDDSLFFKLVRLVNLTARPFVETLSRTHRLSLNEWRAMVVLASHPGVAARDVAEHTGLDKMSVSRALAALEREQRVRRTPDPADARRARLWLSPRGERLFRAIGEQASRREARLYAALTAPQRAQLGRLVDRLIGSIAAHDALPGERGVRIPPGGGPEA